MNDNYKFLGTISAIYEFANADENYYITLTVFNDDCDLKIIYNNFFSIFIEIFTAFIKCFI